MKTKNGKATFKNNTLNTMLKRAHKQWKQRAGKNPQKQWNFPISKFIARPTKESL